MTEKITLVISVVGTSTIEVDADWYREQTRRGDLEFELERHVKWCPFKVTVTEPDGTTIRWDWHAH